jgi:hypothetical protein
MASKYEIDPNHVDEFIKLNTPEALRKRRRAVDKHGRYVDDLVDSVLKDQVPEDKSPTERMELAGNIVKSFAKEWYKTMMKDIPKDLSEEMIDTYLKQVGINMTYNSLVKYLADNEATLDAKNQGNRYLFALRQRLILAKDKDAVRSEKLQEMITSNHAYRPHVVEKISPLLPKHAKLGDAASVEDWISEYNTHINRESENVPTTKTYYDKPKEYEAKKKAA